MALKKLLFSLTTLPLANAETIIGAFILHRHGDRTPKSYPPASLTALGADEVYESGNYYRNRYVGSDASHYIYGISTNIAVPSQLSVQAPVDTVLQNSALAFLQSLYPPISSLTQELANGSDVSFPLNGYQYIPVNTNNVASNANSEDNEWLQAGSGCANALISSNAYFQSDEYRQTLNDTEGFYQSLLPVINGTFSSSAANFKNAFTIWDLINVATIHNSTIPSQSLLTNSTMTKLKSLADTHEWNLAYNASSLIRAISGKVLAGQILEHLRGAISSSATTRLEIQFDAYATFFSFFGLANLPSISSDFKGIVNYASSMAFELFTTSDNITKSNWPAESDLKVRFLFANGTAAENTPQAYPLFGGSETEISWASFVEGMEGFAISNNEQWCTQCGNSTGMCAAYVSSVDSSSSTGGGRSGSVSAPVAGVIGALVALAVVLGAEALAMAFAGLRVVKKGARVASTSDPKALN